MSAREKTKVRFTVTKEERSALEIARALRRLSWQERGRVLRAALILAGGMLTEETKLR